LALAIRPDEVAEWVGSAPTTVTLDGALARANVEIRDAEHRHHLRKAQDLELRVPIAMIDWLLDELEILNLLEVRRGPSSFEGRLDQIRDLLGARPSLAQHAEGLRVRVAINRLMDALFDLQEAILITRRKMAERGHRGNRA
jgi:hypothetical protein